MTQPAPSYQPYRPLPPLMGVAAPQKPSRGGLTSMLAGILALVAAGLAVGGSFAPITSYRNTYEGSGDTTVTANNIGWWGLKDAGSSSPFDSESLLFGLALVLVAVLLVLGAVFAFVASRTRAAGPTTGGRSLITAGAGVLGGVMLLESLQVLENASNYNSRELEPGESLEFSVGLGFVLPLCAVGLGVIAVVLAHVGQQQRGLRVEPNTPRMGFPAPYGYQPGAPMGTPAAGVAMAGAPVPGAPAVGAPVGSAASGASAAELPTEVELGASEEDVSGETTQVVSSATASGQGSVAEGLSGEAPAAVTPPAPVGPPTGSGVAGDAFAPGGSGAPGVAPGAPGAAPVAPAGSGAPGAAAAAAAAEAGLSAPPASGSAAPTQAAPAAPAPANAPAASTASGMPDAPAAPGNVAPAGSEPSTGSTPSTAPQPTAPQPSANPQASSSPDASAGPVPSASPESSAGPDASAKSEDSVAPAAPASSEAATPGASAEAPAADAAKPAAGPTPLTDLPAAPPAPELSEEAGKDGK